MRLRQRLGRTGSWQQVEQEWQFLDTFDWRLFNHRSALLSMNSVGKGERSLVWLDLDSGEAKRVMMIEGAAPIRLGDFPSGPFRDDLKPVIDVRALIPVLDMRLQIARQEGRTETARSVATIEIRSCELRSGKGSWVDVTLTPKGREEEIWKAMLSDLKREMGVPDESLKAAYSRWLGHAGKRPGDYSSKIRLGYDPTMTTVGAAMAIYTSLINVMELNVAGVLEDLDSEFLHDFRVAVRRTRSAIGAIKQVFHRSVKAPFRAEFAWLGKVTGPVRDLDVYLLDLDRQMKRFARPIAAQLANYRAFVEARRDQAFEEMVVQLRSPRFKRLMKEWRAFVHGGYRSHEMGDKANLAAVDTSSAWVWKAYRRLVRKGSSIHVGSPAERLHELRILGKKTRYLMEFFRSAHDPKRINPLIKQVKQLLEVLGDFNDLAVQRSHIAIDAVSVASLQDGHQIVLALGHLDAYLELQQKRVRDSFRHYWARFDSRENHRMFRELFDRKACRN